MRSNPRALLQEAKEEQQLQEFTTQLKNAKEKYIELNTSILEPAHKNSRFTLSEDKAKKIFTIGQKFNDLSECTLAVMQIAILRGADTKFCHRIQSVASGLHTFGGGLEKIAASKSLLSLGGMSGGLNVVVGIMSVFGKNKGDSIGHALQQVMDVLVELFQAMKIIYDSIITLTKFMSENLAVVHRRLNQISDKLNRLENIISTATKELHSKDFIDIFDAIEKDIRGEYQLSAEARNNYLIRLSTWMEYHSKSPVQTFFMRESNEVGKIVEILSSDAFDSSIMLSFLIAKVQALAPTPLLGHLNLNEIPNIALMNIGCEFYTIAINAYGLGENYLPCLMRTTETLRGVEQIINAALMQPEIYEKLFLQYEDVRRQVGIAIAKCRAEFPGDAKPETSLQNLLKNDTKSEQLKILLDQLELRRLLLFHLCDLTHNFELLEKVKGLESKQVILSRSKKFYDDTAATLIHAASRGDLNKFKFAIKNGANTTTWDNWGQAIHYICMQWKFGDHKWDDNESSQLLHYLFKDSEVEFGNLSQQNWPPTWGSHISCIRMILNNSFFENAVLWCAQGNDIVEHYNHFYNGLLWANSHAWNAIMQKYLVRDMNNPTGVLNKQDLRKAYQFYKAIEAGETVSHEGINQDCILWLVAILGNLDVIKAIPNFNSDVNKVIPIINFTPMMMAVYCGQKNVVDYLISKNARLDVDFIVRDPGPRDWHPSYVPTTDHSLSATNKPYLFWIATNFNRPIAICHKLIAAGLVPNAAQRAKIAIAEAKVSQIAAIPPIVITQPRNVNSTKQMLSSSIQKLKDAIDLINQEREAALEAKEEKQTHVVLTPLEEELISDLSSILDRCNFFYERLTEFATIPRYLENINKLIISLQSCITLKTLKQSVPILNTIYTQFNEADVILSDQSNYRFSNNMNNFLRDQLAPLKKKIEKYTAEKEYGQSGNPHPLFSNTTTRPAVQTTHEEKNTRTFTHG